MQGSMVRVLLEEQFASKRCWRSCRRSSIHDFYSTDAQSPFNAPRSGRLFINIETEASDYKDPTSLREGWEESGALTLPFSGSSHIRASSAQTSDLNEGDWTGLDWQYRPVLARIAIEEHPGTGVNVFGSSETAVIRHQEP